IATSYAPASNPAIDEYKPTPSELEAPQYDETKSRERGRLFVLDGTDVNHDGKVNVDDLRWTYLDGDGDFRSDEVTALRDEADIV
ncbi:adenine-specific methyltransferase EcoRI family protein, partial [Dermacoccus nishinomiyaensis]|uniref:adenine-specific methyltransferase EcoRI family protein n=1 Tax=Dermacoccus nishinomiyaensis TaxID=1274 RepID=UPI001C92CF3C